MSLRGVTHITLARAGRDHAVAFDRVVQGLQRDRLWPGGACFSAGTRWLRRSRDPAAIPCRDATPLAFRSAAEEFDAMASRIRASGARIWKDTCPEGAAPCVCDPDGPRLMRRPGRLAARFALPPSARKDAPCPA